MPGTLQSFNQCIYNPLKSSSPYIKYACCATVLQLCYNCVTGPETWWVYYPSASGGMQSPIDIQTEEATFDPELCHNPLEIGYGGGGAEFGGGGEQEGEESRQGGGSSYREAMTLTNTGNTATISIANSQSCQ